MKKRIKDIWFPIKALVIKEIFAVLRDKKSRITLVVPPLVQLIVLVHAATLDVNNISIGIFNQDNGWYSQELVQRIKGSSYFLHAYEYKTPQAIRESIDKQEVIVALQLQSDFSKLVAEGSTAPVQVILDGRKSNASQIVFGYLNLIFQSYNRDILKGQGIDMPEPITIQYRSFFNPNIEYIYFMVPSMIAVLSMILALMVTAMSVSRERENGTFDQLLVSPLQPWQILVGKMIPAMMISVGESTLLMIASLLLFDVPFKGSLLLLYLSMVVFLFSIVGIGLFISSLSKNQQQSILGTFIFMTPTMLLSGYATPIENMPPWLQPVTNIFPIKHFFIIIRGIFLKDMPTLEVLRYSWPMVLIALFTLTLAGWMFKRRLE